MDQPRAANGRFLKTERISRISEGDSAPGARQTADTMRRRQFALDEPPRPTMRVSELQQRRLGALQGDNDDYQPDLGPRSSVRKEFRDNKPITAEGSIDTYCKKVLKHTYPERPPNVSDNARKAIHLAFESFMLGLLDDANTIKDQRRPTLKSEDIYKLISIREDLHRLQ